MANDRLPRWLAHIYETNPSEIDCSRLQVLLPIYVEHEFDRALRPFSDDQLTAVRIHLDHCPDCREEYEGLREVLALAAEGQLPEPGDLLTHFEDEIKPEQPEPVHHR